MSQNEEFKQLRKEMDYCKLDNFQYKIVNRHIDKNNLTSEKIVLIQ